MSSIFKKIAGAFVEVEPDAAAADTAAAQQPAALAGMTPPAATPAPAFLVPPSPQGPPASMRIVDQDIRQMIIQALDAQNMPGFDYWELRASMSILQGAVADEATRFKTAYSMGTMGTQMTPQQFISTVDHYLGALDREAQEFQAAYDAKREQEVTARQASAASIAAEIERKQALIAETVEQVKALQADMAKATQDMALAEVKLEQDRNAFLSAWESVRAEIAGDKEKLTRYLA